MDPSEKEAHILTIKALQQALMGYSKNVDALKPEDKQSFIRETSQAFHELEAIKSELERF